MSKIVFIGAGSFEFTRELVKDILTFPLLKDGEICLVDIDSERLSYSQRAVERIVKEGGYGATIKAYAERRDALLGADAVICTILAGGVDVWRHDIEIPKKYGVDINVGDTRGVAGIFRAMRTIPVMLEIARDMEDLCPKALLLNYTNPMAMICRAIQKETSIQVTGLCHSVQGTAKMLAKWAGADPEQDDISYNCAGINHQAFYLDFQVNGEDVYQKIREAVEKPEVYNQEIVRNEMYKHLGYYVTESSGHNSEYNWWFRKRPDLIEKYCTHGTGWNPGVHAYIKDKYLRREDDWKKDIKVWLDSPDPLNLDRGEEYAAYIINAYLGGEPYKFNGNVPNRGSVDNLTREACVEVPVYADKNGINPLHVGNLPANCAALVNFSIAIEEMAVEGSIKGDPDLIYQAVALSPLSASVLSLQEIKDMVNEMLVKNRAHLPQFSQFEVK